MKTIGNCPKFYFLFCCLFCFIQQGKSFENGISPSFHSRVIDSLALDNDTIIADAGNLLIGRQDLLTASSTCGLNGTESYRVYDLRDGYIHLESDGLCNSQHNYQSKLSTGSHRIENLINSNYPISDNKWWQSRNSDTNVSITLQLDTYFSFISTRIVFRTYPPAAMTIEKSSDFGETWSTIAYFSNNCEKDFKDISTDERKNPTDISCSKKYSSLVPSKGGIVEFRLIPQGNERYTKENYDLQNFTSIRLQFLKMNKIGGDPLSHYYAVDEWMVRGQCACNGHARLCVPMDKSEINSNRQIGKIKGKCQCKHHTEGDYCEQCQEFYWDQDWEYGKPCKQCQCNEHALKCKFDPVVFVAKNGTSGSNCDEWCMHNTAGENCQECKEGFYRNPLVNITNIRTCIPCVCNEKGSLFPISCIKYKVQGISSGELGQCDCKNYVTGFHCDRCKPGYWNLSMENPNGCDSCDCEPNGTPGNAGCDQLTGRCQCKRFVTGKRCNECKEGFYGLSTHPDGCAPCACIAAGTQENKSCNKFTGRCPCRAGFEGRDCGRIIDGFYVLIPALPLDARGTIYTESLFVPITTRFISVVQHFELKKFHSNEEWFVQLEPLQYGREIHCGGHSRLEPFPVNETQASVYILPQQCVLPGKTIDFRLITVKSPPETIGRIYIKLFMALPVENASSVSLLRDAHLCEPYRFGSRNQRPRGCGYYGQHGLLDGLWNVVVKENIPIHPCECDIQGSISINCNKFTGQCDCQPGVEGVQCQRCKAHFYGFSRFGCQDCDCDRNGAENVPCDVESGQCICHSNFFGQRCDSCAPMHYHYPQCGPCDCNDLADSCDSITGECQDCRDNTMGPQCEMCIDGYYGNPLQRIPCEPCPCLMSHTDKCEMFHDLKSHENKPICKCHAEYSGEHCEKCSVGYFGENVALGGKCSPCPCYDNIDYTDPDACDSLTGECLKCQNHTGGRYCQECIQGYFGNALVGNCVQCKCYLSGSIPESATFCDQSTGQCLCQPFVTGLACDRCFRRHYGIKSGKGCSPCDCDRFGSEHPDCDEITGQCACKAGRGGRQCNLCEDNYWGDPKKLGGCQKCDCNPAGTEWCDKVTGSCKCRKGVIGSRCDQCGSGTNGDFPNCTLCGDCWTDWLDYIDQQFQNHASTQLKLSLDQIPKKESVKILQMNTNLVAIDDYNAQVKQFTDFNLQENVNEFKTHLDSLLNQQTIQQQALVEKLSILTLKSSVNKNPLQVYNNFTVNLLMNSGKYQEEKLKDLENWLNELEVDGQSLWDIYSEKSENSIVHFHEQYENISSYLDWLNENLLVPFVGEVLVKSIMKVNEFRKELKKKDLLNSTLVEVKDLEKNLRSTHSLPTNKTISNSNNNNNNNDDEEEIEKRIKKIENILNKSTKTQMEQQGQRANETIIKTTKILQTFDKVLKSEMDLIEINNAEEMTRKYSEENEEDIASLVMETEELTSFYQNANLEIQTMESMINNLGNSLSESLTICMKSSIDYENLANDLRKIASVTILGSGAL